MGYYCLMNLKPRLQWLTLTLIGIAALWVRFRVIEPADMAHRCEPLQAPWWCTLRLGIVMTFASFGLGYACILAVIAALLIRLEWVAWAAAVLGVLALSWYCQEPGALSLLVGVLLLARLQQNAAGKEQA